jgi:chromate transporter
MRASKEKDLWQHEPISPPWGYFLAFVAFAAGSLALSLGTDHLVADLFESFYRYGYLVIGGGQVVVPLMYSELVDINQYMSNQEFLTGFGLVQGLPGPMFSFSAYAGGMAARGQGFLFQIAGAMTGGVAIFLPGFLLIFFIYPVWEKLRQIKGIKVALGGITAVAGGLIASAAVVLMQRSGFQPDHFLILIITALLLLSKKILAPLIVLMVLGAGVIL